MHKKFSFINSDDTFKNQYYRRKFIDIDKNHELDENKLISIISHNIIQDAKEQNSGINYYSIAVDEADGMSWSIESLKQNLCGIKPHFKTFCIQPKDDTNFAISSIIGETEILKIAKKNKLASSYKQKNSIASFVTIVLGVFLALIFVGLQEVIKKNFPQNYEDIPKLLQNYYFFIVFIIAVIIGVLIKIYSNDKKLNNKGTVSDELNQKVKNKETENSEEFKTYINSLCSIFQKKINFPIFIFVDEYEKLDIITKSIIKTYLNNLNIVNRGAETWIVFHTDVNKFDKPVLALGTNFNSHYNFRTHKKTIFFKNNHNSK